MKRGMVTLLVLGIVLISMSFVLADTLVIVPRLKSPVPVSTVITSEGNVTIDASESYVVNRRGNPGDDERPVYCLAGLCPPETTFPDIEGGANVTVEDHDSKPLNIPKVEFVWEFDGKAEPTKRGSDAHAYVFDKFYLPSDRFYWLKLTMNYYSDAPESLLTSSILEVPFKVSYTQTTCSPEGVWISRGGGTPWPYPGCYIEGRGTCCPTTKECHINTGNCVESNTILCVDYHNPTDCNNDNAGVAIASVSNKRDDGKTCPQEIGYDPNNCLQHLTNCKCEWVGTAESGNCTSSYNVSTSTECREGGTSPDIGKCRYTESTSDTCEDDDYLTYSWMADWSWAPGNEVSKYDPLGEETKCKPGSKSIPCPASIKLPFFGVWQLTLSLLGIALIYGWLVFKEEGL